MIESVPPPGGERQVQGEEYLSLEQRILQYLDELQPAPQYAQIAVGRNWEKAVRVELAHEMSGSESGLIVDPSIAGEVFYSLQDGRRVFFGTRYTPGLRAAPTPEKFLKQFLGTISGIKEVGICVALEKFGEQMNSDPSTYTSADIELLEVGIVDNWKSMGSLVIRQGAGPNMNQFALGEILRQNPVLLDNDKNHVALEFAFTYPKFWLGVQLSELVNGRYRTNLRTLETLVNI